MVIKYDAVIIRRTVVVVCVIFLLGLPGLALPRGMTLCDCVNKPIKGDAMALACGQLTESFSPDLLTTETLKCRETLAVPENGVDFCFCMRSNSQDPKVQQACLDLANSISPDNMYSVTKDCARKQYE